MDFILNKPVHELIAYASSEGSDKPAHPRKIVSALTPNCPHTHRRNENEGTFLNLG